MKNIILLEDEEVLGKIYKKNLEAAGHEVIWVKTTEGVEGVVGDCITIGGIVKSDAIVSV